MPEDFDPWWDAYGKKRSRVTAERAWIRMTVDERNAAMIAVQDYVRSTPDKEYRKDPTTWLNQKCWDDEVIERSDGKRKHKIGRVGNFDEFKDNPLMEDF